MDREIGGFPLKTPAVHPSTPDCHSGVGSAAQKTKMPRSQKGTNSSHLMIKLAQQIMLIQGRNWASSQVALAGGSEDEH